MFFNFGEPSSPPPPLTLSMLGAREPDADFVAGLELLGEAAVRSEVESGLPTHRLIDKRRWLHEKELARQVAAINAAMASAEAAQKSAKWATWSAVIAVVALLVAVVK